MSDFEESDIELDPFESPISEDDGDEDLREVPCPNTTVLVMRKPSKSSIPLTWTLAKRCGSLVDAKQKVFLPKKTWTPT